MFMGCSGPYFPFRTDANEEGAQDRKAVRLDEVVHWIGRRKRANNSRPLHGVGDDIGSRKARRSQGSRDRDQRTILRVSGETPRAEDAVLGHGNDGIHRVPQPGVDF